MTNKWSVVCAVASLFAGMSLPALEVHGGDDSFVETFSGGSNEGGWTWGAGNSIPDTGGNPGAYLRTQGLDTFAAQPRTTSGGIFIGNLRDTGVNSIGLDLITFAANSTGGRPLTLMLIDDNGTATIADDTAAYVEGPNIPDVGDGWLSYDYPIPSQATELPDGWALLNLNDAYTEPIHTWDEVIQNVSEIRYFYGNPLYVFIFQQWTLGLDNARITMTPKGVPGDVNGDGVVNVSDLIEVINQWGDCDRPPAVCDADLNGDGEVNVTDLILVITNWSA